MHLSPQLSNGLQKPRALFVFEASASIGGGHMSRSLAFGGALASEFEVTVAHNRSAAEFITGSRFPLVTFPDGEVHTYLASLAEARAALPDTLVVDHYGVDAASERPLRELGVKVVVIDDLANRAHAADVLIDSTPSAAAGRYRDLVPSECRLLLGADYALLRPEFRAARLASAPIATQAQVTRILVSMGATDPANATSYVLDALGKISAPIEVTVVLGRSSPVMREVEAAISRQPYPVRLAVDVRDMATLYGAHDLAIGAPATSMLERACVGLPSILIETAENQRPLSTAMAAMGAARVLGLFRQIPHERIAEVVCSLIADDGLRCELADRGRRLVDGLGAERAAANLAPDFEAMGGRLVGRRLRAADADAILAWQAAPEARRFSRNPAIPSADEHARWISGRLQSSAAVTEIVEFEGCPVAMVRLDPRGEHDEVSVIVSQDHAGQGIGTAAVRYITRLDQHRPKWAFAHPENAASIALFERCGYANDGNRQLRYLDVNGPG